MMPPMPTASPIATKTPNARPTAALQRQPVVFLQHHEHFGPGRLIRQLGDYGIPTEVRRLDRGDPVPADLDECRCVVSLGGPMTVASSPDWLESEVSALAGRIEADEPTIGIGLGAAVVAKAAGAEVKPLTDGDGNEVAEHGFVPLKLPFPGGTDPLVFGLADGTPMLMWATETFELPKLPPPAGYDPDKPGPPPPTGNALIASTPTVKNAAFRFKARTYGFAFHFEQPAAAVKQIVDAHGSGVSLTADPSDAQRDRHERMGQRIGTNLVQFLKVY